MHDQLDYILCAYGFSFILLGTALYRTGRGIEDSLPWRWLAAFGFVHGVHEWLAMVALSTGDPPAFRAFRLAVLVGSFILLFEFGRRGWRAQGSRALGWWACPVLIGLMLLGSAGGLKGLNISCRYALGLPGSLLAGGVLLRAAKRLPAGRRWPLVSAGVAMVVYSLATGAVVQKAGFFPASVLNEEAFLATGFPIQLLRAMCAAVVAAGVCGCRKAPSLDGLRRYRRYVMAAAVTILLAGGWGVTEWRGRVADKALRDRILRQATEIAGAINPEQIRRLSFTLEDRNNPAFQRLRGQLIAFGHAIHQRSIYSIALRNDAIVFGPENLAETDPLASPPGTVYQQPTEQDCRSLRTGEAFTEGPHSDEYGTFVSAFSPVRDPRTSQVLMLVGLDVVAEDWSIQIARQRLVPILFTVSMVTLLLAAGMILDWRERTRCSHRGFRYVEAILTAVGGLVLTTAASLVAHDGETRARRLMFSQVADAHAGSVAEFVQDLRDLQLTGLAHFHEAREEVTREEFHRYAGSLADNASIQAFEWIPRVAASERQNAEDLAHRQGVNGFAIYQKDSQGRHVPAAGREEFYPVFYVEPLAGNAPALGYDIGSEPVRRAAMEEAGRTGLPVATDPVTLVQESGHSKGILIFQAVFRHAPLAASDPNVSVQTSRLRGFALAVLHVECILAEALADCDQRSPVTRVDLHRLKEGEPPQWLACWPPAPNDKHENGQLLAPGEESELSAVCPLFACGKCYAIVVSPGPAFLAANPARAGVATGGIGLILTMVMTGIVGFVTHRRAILEQEVFRRTAELEQLRQAEEQVRANERQLAEAQRLAHVGSWRWQVRTGLVRLSEETYRILGLQPEDVITEYESLLAYMHPDDRETRRRHIQDAMDGTESQYECEYRLVRPDGSIRFVQSRGEVIRDSDGCPTEVVGMVQDITVRKKAEALERERTRLQAAVTSMEQVLGVVGHELRTPLAGIRAMAEYLLMPEAKQTSEYDEFVTAINAEVIRMAQMTNDILEAARLSSGTARWNWSSFVLMEVCQEAIDTVSSLVDSGSVDLSLAVEPPDLAMQGDPAAVRRLVLNLLTNAYKHTPKGSIAVRAKPLLDECGNWIEIRVQDTGEGMSAQTAEKLGEAFALNSGVVGDRFVKGAGLGLAICRGIVGAHGGSIEVQSELGRGTIIVVRVRPDLSSPVVQKEQIQIIRNIHP